MAGGVRRVGYYRDLREYIEVLDDEHRLTRIKREINKDTELQPLVRWQFRGGLPEKERKAFLFENVVDARGKRFDIPVLVGSHASSRQIYALAMMCEEKEIAKKWEQAFAHPIEPRVIPTGPVHEEVHLGDNLLEHGGMDEFPVPISTPGFDNAPYLTAGNWVTKDLETGIRNVGNYRGMVKSQTRLGCFATGFQHLPLHYDQYKEKGIPLPAAVIIGPTPNVGITAVTKVPYDADEFAVAGAIANKPLELVKCKTVDLEVPATAEIVIEGEIPTDSLEREAPFGEFTGYMGMDEMTLYFNVTCITHRRNPIWNAFISQFPPSESSVLRGIGRENAYYKFLRYDVGIRTLVDVAFHQESGSNDFLVVSLKKTDTSQVWQVLNAAVALDAWMGKIIVAVDEDIDPRDMDSVIWALCYRMQPGRDIRMTHGKAAGLDPSALPLTEKRQQHMQPSSAILIDATRKWDYPPVALPKQEYMEQAKKIWEEEGLPSLTPKVPWYGYSLGYWPREFEEEAQLAVKGEHYRTGEKLAKKRVKSTR